MPLLVNLQPAGDYLGEDFYRAGGMPAVIRELILQGLIAEHAKTVNGRSIGDNCRDAIIENTDFIVPTIARSDCAQVSWYCAATCSIAPS